MQSLIATEFLLVDDDIKCNFLFANKNNRTDVNVKFDRVKTIVKLRTLAAAMFAK